MLTIEHTDTYGGESNYSWVCRYHCKADGLTKRQQVTLAKKVTGFTGIRCRVDNFSDMLAIYPRGVCHVVFVRWDEDRYAGHWGKEVDKAGNTVEPKEEE